MSYETRFRAFAENACVEEKAARYDDKREAELTKRGEAAAFSRMIPDAKEADAEIAALTERLRAVEAERDEARNGVKKSAEAYGALMEHAEKLRAELQRKDAALKIYQARSHRNANSTCDGCPFAVAERDVNWADRPEGYYTCGLDNKERWGEDPKCPEMLYKEPPCQTA